MRCAPANTSAGNELLADIRVLFAREQIDKIKTADLIDELCDDEERPWDTYNRGREITPRQLANLLAPYGIRSKTVRFGDKTPKGFERSQFADAFTRYLPESQDIPTHRDDPPDSTNNGDSDDSGEY